MFNLSQISKERLLECDEKLQSIVKELLKTFNVTVLQYGGHRSLQVQQMLFEAGKSKVVYPNSKHNSEPSRAVDIAPYPVDWDDLYRFYYMAGEVFRIAHFKGINIRWGGDWNGNKDFSDQNFNDLPHFELL